MNIIIQFSLDVPNERQERKERDQVHHQHVRPWGQHHPEKARNAKTLGKNVSTCTRRSVSGLSPAQTSTLNPRWRERSTNRWIRASATSCALRRREAEGYSCRPRLSCRLRYTTHRRPATRPTHPYVSRVGAATTTAAVSLWATVIPAACAPSATSEPTARLIIPSLPSRRTTLSKSSRR